MSSSFEYTPENQKRLEQILKRYPTKRAAMLPSLHLAIEQNGYISEEQVIRGTICKKILSLTEKARNYLREKGWKVPDRKTNAGAEHEYWKTKIKRDLERQGAHVEEEVAVKSNEE